MIFKYLNITRIALNLTEMSIHQVWMNPKGGDFPSAISVLFRM